MCEISLLVTGSIEDMTQKMVGTQETRRHRWGKITEKRHYSPLFEKHLRNLSMHHFASICCLEQPFQIPSLSGAEHPVAVCCII